MPHIQLGKKLLRADSEPYLIAEIGVNHEGRLDLAKRLIALAREGGADAAKFQTYKADKIASRHSPSYWDLNKEPTTSQYRLFQKYDGFGPEEYRTLARHCHEVGIDFLSTPFDLEAVDMLDALMPFFKIASADLTNIPLLRRIASKNKPIVLSTGASNPDEIDVALKTLRLAGARDLALLHCVLNYPLDYPNAHLNMIAGLAARYPEFIVGYSDHTVPDAAMVVLTSAYLKGARILEKHFTHDKKLPGNDHYHAMDVNDLRVYRRNLSLIRTIEGEHFKAALPSEEIARQNARRSIVLACAVKAGEALSEVKLICKRPGTGISPLDWDRVITLRARRDLAEDHVLRWDDVV